MTDVKTGGKRRIDYVLADDFDEGLEALDTGEVRRRRDLARAELEYLSLLRRLLQGRVDILRAEAARRAEGAPSKPLVDQLSEILSEGSRGPSRGEVPVMAVPEEEVSLARRRVERLVSDAHLSNVAELDDEEIEAAVDRLETEERRVSDVRGRVIAVHDVVQEEMKRRLRSELSDSV